MPAKGELVVAQSQLPAIKGKPPAIVVAAGRPAQNAWRDFFANLKLKNSHTKRSYEQKIRRFLDWCHDERRELAGIMPGDVSEFIHEQVGGAATTQKAYRSALNKFFKLLVVRI